MTLVAVFFTQFQKYSHFVYFFLNIIFELKSVQNKYVPSSLDRVMRSGQYLVHDSTDFVNSLISSFLSFTIN